MGARGQFRCWRGRRLRRCVGREVANPGPERDGRAGDSIDGLVEASLRRGGEDEGGSHARVLEASSRSAPVDLEEGGIGERAHDRVIGVGGVGEFADDGFCFVAEAEAS